MSFAAEPYGVFVDDLVSSLTGGIIREEFVYPSAPDKPRLAAGNQFLPDTVRLHGISGGSFKRFSRERDYRIDSEGVISWLSNTSSSGSAIPVYPDEGSRFYVSYEAKAGYRRQSPLSDRNPGSIIRILSESFAREYAVLSRQMEKVYKAAFLETAANRDLDQVAALVGISRRDQRFAGGEVVFSRPTPAPADIIIPEGSLISTSEVPPITVETLEQAILRSGTLSVSVRVRSTVAGAGGKAEADTLTVIHRPVLGIQTATNPQALSFRVGKEEDEVLRRRVGRALETSGRATVGSLIGALVTIDGVREEDIGIEEDHLHHPGVVRITIAAELTESQAVRAVELINEHKPAGIRIQHNLQVSPPAELPVESGEEGGEDGVESMPAATTDNIWHPVALSVALMPADPALTTTQKAQIMEKVKQAILDHLDGLGLDKPVIHNRVLSEIMRIDGVFDVGLEIFDLVNEGARRKNIQPTSHTRAQLKEENLTITMRGSLVALDLTLAVTRKDLRTIDDPQTELARVRDEVVATINSELAGAGRPLDITVAFLQAALGGSVNFDVEELSFKAEFLEEGLRINQGNPPITIRADQQPWLRLVTVTDSGGAA